MCLGRRRPTPPPLPEPEPLDSAIEPTATKVSISDDRTMGQPKVKKKKTIMCMYLCEMYASVCVFGKDW